MKTFWISIVFLFMTTGYIISQRVDTIHFDQKDHIVSSKDFNYYRIAKQDGDIVRVSDYYKSGELKMSGSYTSFNFKDEIGPFYYYKKGKIHQIELNQPTKYPDIYSKFKERLDFIPNLPDSLKLVVIFSNSEKINEIGFVRECCDKYSQWFYFFGGEKIIDLITFKNGKRNGPLNVYRNKVLVYSANYKNDIRDGIFQRFDNNGKLIQTKYFTNGKKTK